MGMRYLPINSGSTAVTKVVAEKIQLIINKKRKERKYEKRTLSVIGNRYAVFNSSVHQDRRPRRNVRIIGNR